MKKTLVVVLMTLILLPEYGLTKELNENICTELMHNITSNIIKMSSEQPQLANLKQEHLQAGRLFYLYKVNTIPNTSAHQDGKKMMAFSYDFFANDSLSLDIECLTSEERQKRTALTFPYRNFGKWDILFTVQGNKDSNITDLKLWLSAIVDAELKPYL